ncbi:hypothetical protein PMHK_13390 [Pseudomonas sp. MHK4]
MLEQVYRLFHCQLLNRQCHIALGAFQIVGQVGDKDVQGGQGLAGVAEQVGGVDAGDDGEVEELLVNRALDNIDPQQ